MKIERERVKRSKERNKKIYGKVHIEVRPTIEKDCLNCAIKFDSVNGAFRLCKRCRKRKGGGL